MTKIIYIKKAIRSYNTLAYNFLKKYLFLLVWVGFSDKKCALRENRSELRGLAMLRLAEEKDNLPNLSGREQAAVFAVAEFG